MIVQKFDYKECSRTNINGKRHYCLPDGAKVPSVTTVLDKTKPEEKKLALENWRRRVGYEQAQQITTEAASRGTRMHKWLENHIKLGDLGQPGTNPYSQQSHSMAKIIIEQGLEKSVSEYWGVEVPLYYSGLYAGTTDCIGVWNNKPAIIDFKQTNKPKKSEWIEDYYLQLAAYALAHNNTHGTDIRHGVILMCSSEFKFQLFEITDNDFKKYEQKWFDRVEQYYREN